MGGRLKGIGAVAAIGAAVVLFCLAARWQTGSDHGTIRNWAAANGCAVTSITSPWFDRGPFWVVAEDDRLYRVEVRDRAERPKVAYFRFRGWWHDVEWGR